MRGRCRQPDRACAARPAPRNDFLWRSQVRRGPGGARVRPAQGSVLCRRWTARILLGHDGPGAPWKGDGDLAPSAQLPSPHGVAVDATGNVYIADTANCRIRKVSVSNGAITTVAGNGTCGFGGGSGPATSVQLQSPAGIALDSLGNLYIADSGNNVVRQVSLPNGTIATVAGSGSYRSEERRVGEEGRSRRSPSD